MQPTKNTTPLRCINKNDRAIGRFLYTENNVRLMAIAYALLRDFFPRPRDKDQGSTWEADRQGLREWVVPQRKNKQTSMTSKERNDSKTNITEG